MKLHTYLRHPTDIRSDKVKPTDWAHAWELKLFEPIPVPGMANTSTWRGTAPGTTRAPGKNHPDVGAWLVNRYCPPEGVCVDPMIGSGGLWVKVSSSHLGTLQACEVEESLCHLSRENIKLRKFRLANVECSDAREWKPSHLADLVLFSPPFLQNHSSGATAHQQNIRERKSLHTMQEFGAHPDNLGRKNSIDFWNGMGAIYAGIREYVKPKGYVIVILRNRIRHAQEVDEIGQHISLMRSKGLCPIGSHARDLVRPTGYQAWKLARNPGLPWIKYEWAIVTQKSHQE
jgi:hypothetical protein